MSKASMAAQFLRARAWWRLDSVGPSAAPVARSVVSLLDAAAYVGGLPSDDPALVALDHAGCFTGGIFDPGPEGWLIVRDWQLAEESTAGPEDLLAQLAQAADRNSTAAYLAGLTGVPAPGLTEPGLTEPGLTEPGLTEPGLTDPEQTIIIPRQPGPAAVAAALRWLGRAAEGAISAPRR